MTRSFFSYFSSIYWPYAARRLLCCLLLATPLSFAETTVQVTAPDCVKGQAGPIATLALLSKKAGVSDDDFYTFWRDIHGGLAARIPGFWSYRQYHLGGEVSSLRRLPNGYAKTLEPVHGFADVSYCNQAAIAGLVGSNVAALIREDERNAFSSTYLYGAIAGDSRTLKRSAVFPNGQGDSLIVFLAKGQSEPADEFKAGLSARLAALPQACPALKRLRVNYFQPYDANAWNAPEVNHSPSQVYDAAVEFQFNNREASLQCINDHFDFGSSAARASRVRVAYSVNQRYAMVVDGLASMIALRGLQAMELIQRLGANNQISKPVLNALYGDVQ